MMERVRTYLSRVVKPSLYYFGRNTQEKNLEFFLHTKNLARLCGLGSDNGFNPQIYEDAITEVRERMRV